MAADFSKDILLKKCITSLQAHIRGVLVRSKLTEVQKQFESIVYELDGPEFHVIWNSKTLAFPVITKKLNDSRYKLLVDCRNESKSKEILLTDECEEDKTITQEDYDKILNGTCNDNGYTQLPMDVDKSIRENLEDKFNKMTVCSETGHTNDEEINSKPDNEVKSDNLRDNSVSSSVRPSESNMNSEPELTSPGSVDDGVFIQHSTPVASQGPRINKNEDLRRHPLLTESWMTDKSFDPVGSCDTDSNAELPTNADDLQQRREQVVMELLWTQQAVESRKNYLKLKKNMDQATN